MEKWRRRGSPPQDKKELVKGRRPKAPFEMRSEWMKYGGEAGLEPSQICNGKFRCGKFRASPWVLCGTLPEMLWCVGLSRLSGAEPQVPISRKPLNFVWEFRGQFETRNFPNEVDCPRNPGLFRCARADLMARSEEATPRHHLRCNPPSLQHPDPAPRTPHPTTPHTP